LSAGTPADTFNVFDVRWKAEVDLSGGFTEVNPSTFSAGGKPERGRKLESR